MTSLLTVSCAKKPILPSFTFSEDQKFTFEIDEKGKAIEISFTSSLPWTAIVSSGEDFISCSPSGGDNEGTQELSVKVEPNSSYDFRSGSITLTSIGETETLTKVFTFNQSQKNAIILSTTSINLPFTGGNFSVNLKTNIKFSVDISKPWITRVPDTKALKDSVITFTAEFNEATEERAAEITFSNKESGLRTTFTVNQEEFHNPFPETTAPGLYSGIYTIPTAIVDFEAQEQYTYGKSASDIHTYTIDFSKGTYSCVTISPSTIVEGNKYEAEIIHDNAQRTVQIVCTKKSGMKAWFENTSERTGIIMTLN